MTLTPGLLLTVAAERVRAACPALSAHLDLSTPQALHAAKAEITAQVAADDGDGALVVVVIGHFSLTDWVRETCRFALALPADRAASWRRSFTRTVYLAGRPDNLRHRFAFDQIAVDGSMAWFGPATGRASTALRRLLKTFSGERELTGWLPTTVEIPPACAPSVRDTGGRRPVHRELYVATAKVTVSDVLVQTNHLLIEAAMDGLIGEGDRLSVRFVPRLGGLAGSFAALRVDTDAHRPYQLQAYAGLTEEI